MSAIKTSPPSAAAQIVWRELIALDAAEVQLKQSIMLSEVERVAAPLERVLGVDRRPDALTLLFAEFHSKLQNQWATARDQLHQHGGVEGVERAIKDSFEARGVLANLICPLKSGAFSKDLNISMSVVSTALKAADLPASIINPELRQAIDVLAQPHVEAMLAHEPAFKGVMRGGKPLATALRQPDALPPFENRTLKEYVHYLAESLAGNTSLVISSPSDPAYRKLFEQHLRDFADTRDPTSPAFAPDSAAAGAVSLSKLWSHPISDWIGSMGKAEAGYVDLHLAPSSVTRTNRG